MRAGAFLAGLALLATAPGAAALPPDQETVHVVEAGETLNGIANRAAVPRSVIIEANGLEPPYIIRVGQKLDIPREGVAARRSIPNPSRTAPDGIASYVVKPGDTLGGIANREKVPRVLIAEANRLKPPYTIRVGQTLMIPRTRRHEVQAGDTGFGIALNYAVPWSNIAIANGLDGDAPLQAGTTLLIPTVLPTPETAPGTATAAPAPSASRFAWPVAGDIRRGFRARGSGNHHDGIDIVAPRGAAVRAVAAGEVIFARKEDSQFGNLVVVDHGDGWHSAYASLDRITVKKGHKVTKGERVGLVGNTSVTGKTELHFELRREGKVVDPLDELPKAE